ncbi:MAG: rhamnulokinase family protein [Candidatus Saccharicenans sp.]|nr:rhamnulokinase family protein [Candidatus Saccharicenans sp.]MDI6849058.1 rhamnulokinase family protein [Candidatus Saccharicenans sp.]
MKPDQFLAFDLGAESGRAMLGRLEAGRLTLKEIHRFPNKTILLENRWHWNLYYLFEEIRKVLKDCCRNGLEVASLGVDTWGVDFGLLDERGNLLTLPYCYRHRSFPAAMERYFKNFSGDELYRLTGIQFLPFNSLFQLYCYLEENPGIIKAARKLLFTPDLINYLLTGKKVTELTIASTSQILSPVSRSWVPELLERMGIPSGILPEINQPGTNLGKISDWLVKDGAPAIEVVQVASHDTASAVAAAPGRGEDWLYISCGTWSLVGVELPEPVITGDSLAANFTNESGLGRTIRFLKNVTGLWPLQQCRKVWARNRDLHYDQLVEMASAARPFQFYLDPDAPEFLNPDNMVTAIKAYARKTGQREPDGIGTTVRAILESLAFKSRLVVEELSRLTGRKFRTIHLIGGGSRNHLLNQFTAEATGLRVLAGPDEATSAGNILVQALAAETLTDRQEIREVVRRSFEIKEFAPLHPEFWSERYQDFLRVTGLK